MGAKYSEHGGGAATGLGNDFINWLSQGMNTGRFGPGNPAGADAFGATGGISNVLNDILAGGAGNVGGSMQDMIVRNNERQVQDMRARMGVGGGSAFGTGANYAEGVMRAEQAPALTTAIGNLQLQAMSPILQLLGGMSSKGIAQRSGAMTPNPFVSAIGAAAPIIGGALGMASNPFASLLNAATSGAGALAGPQQTANYLQGGAGIPTQLFQNANWAGLVPNQQQIDPLSIFAGLNPAMFNPQFGRP